MRKTKFQINKMVENQQLRDPLGDDQSAAELETVDISSIELDIFRLSKRNQRKRTYVRIT